MSAPAQLSFYQMACILQQQMFSKHLVLNNVNKKFRKFLQLSTMFVDNFDTKIFVNKLYTALWVSCYSGLNRTSLCPKEKFPAHCQIFRLCFTLIYIYIYINSDI